jgi:hypothetical protein
MPLHSPRSAALAGLPSFVLGQLALHAGEGFASMLLSRVSLPATLYCPAPEKSEIAMSAFTPKATDCCIAAK